jgi:hypothetical protein
VCICLCVRARARVGVRKPGRVGVCLRVHVALLIQHATRIPHTVMPFVDTLFQSYFSALSHKRHDIYIYIYIYIYILNTNMCFDVLYNFCLIHFSF